MFAFVQSGTLSGLQLEKIRVEAAICRGCLVFKLLACQRMRSARRATSESRVNSFRLHIPAQESPHQPGASELRKESSLDVPIALASLSASRPQLKARLCDVVVFGNYA